MSLRLCFLAGFPAASGSDFGTSQIRDLRATSGESVCRSVLRGGLFSTLHVLRACLLARADSSECAAHPRFLSACPLPISLARDAAHCTMPHNATTAVALQRHLTKTTVSDRRREENYPALTGGWSGRPDGQLGFPGRRRAANN
eukprot:1184136-Prorocentrum_minimum.AAC.2